jgi:creatinine amidohydrolase
VAADILLLKDQFENVGDHAGGWETSHLLASHPDTVDLSLAEDEMQFGIMSNRNPKNASAGFGHDIYQAAVDALLKKVHARLENPKAFMSHVMDAC